MTKISAEPPADTDREILLDASEAWHAQNGSVDRATLVSPYVTGDTAKCVLAHLGQRGTLITQLKLMDVVQGATSLDAIEELIEQGVTVLDLPGLHAKAAVFDDFGTVGSQNATARGQKNKELSVSVRASSDLEELTSQVTKWRAQASRVSMDTIFSLRERAEQFEARWKELAEAVDDAENELEEEKAKARGRRAGARAIAGLTPATRAKRLVFRLPPHNREVIDNFILEKADYTDDLLRWSTVDGADKELDRLWRYSIIDLDTGRGAFARMVKTRMNFITSRVDPRTVRIDTEKGIYRYNIRPAGASGGMLRGNYISFHIPEDTSPEFEAEIAQEDRDFVSTGVEIIATTVADKSLALLRMEPPRWLAGVVFEQGGIRLSSLTYVTPPGESSFWQGSSPEEDARVRDLVLSELLKGKRTTSSHATHPGAFFRPVMCRNPALCGEPPRLLTEEGELRRPLNSRLKGRLPHIEMFLKAYFDDDGGALLLCSTSSSAFKKLEEEIEIGAG